MGSGSSITCHTSIPEGAVLTLTNMNGHSDYPVIITPNETFEQKNNRVVSLHYGTQSDFIQAACCTQLYTNNSLSKVTIKKTCAPAPVGFFQIQGDFKLSYSVQNYHVIVNLTRYPVIKVALQHTVDQQRYVSCGALLRFCEEADAIAALRANPTLQVPLIGYHQFGAYKAGSKYEVPRPDQTFICLPASTISIYLLAPPPADENDEQWAKQYEVGRNIDAEGFLTSVHLSRVLDPNISGIYIYEREINGKSVMQVVQQKGSMKDFNTSLPEFNL